MIGKNECIIYYAVNVCKERPWVLWHRMALSVFELEIINIHGGGWIIGNKGFENRPTASRYLAQQGYAVFDIQYGLARFPDEPLIDNALGWVQKVLGRELLNKSYTMSEMAVQILGNFTDL